MSKRSVSSPSTRALIETDSHPAAALTPEENQALRTLIARAQIRDVLERYFYGLDARDAQALSSCFTAQAHYEANTGKGRRIVFRGAEQIGTTLVQLIGRFQASLHMTASPAITVEGDRATADVFASAQLSHGQPEVGGVILVRGLRYRDQLERIDGQWRIANRVHSTLWQHNANSLDPFVPPAESDAQ